MTNDHAQCARGPIPTRELLAVSLSESVDTEGDTLKATFPGWPKMQGWKFVADHILKHFDIRHHAPWPPALAGEATSDESRAKATEGKAGMAGAESDPVRRNNRRNGLQVGEPTRIGAVVGDQEVEEPSLNARPPRRPEDDPQLEIDHLTAMLEEAAHVLSICRDQIRGRGLGASLTRDEALSRISDIIIQVEAKRSQEGTG